MGSTYFLGANSKDGFYSLYSGFCADRGDYLSVIKGGPGTGKSGFMKRIAAAAEERGLETERLLCSGAPDSLDGVYIPALKRGWMDGTAPHAAEPGRFGIDGEYIDLGQFCRRPIEDGSGCAAELYERYRALYGEAYGFISAAESVRRCCTPELMPREAQEKLRRRIDNMVESGSGGRGRRQLRFYRALSGKGELSLAGELERLCPRLCVLEDGLGGADRALHFAAESAWRKGQRHVVSLSPSDPARYEAVLLPEQGLGFVSDVFGLEGSRHMRLDALADKDGLHRGRRLIREGQKISGRLTELALERLYEANRLHDELEKYYIAMMDFAALDEFTAEYIGELFGGAERAH